MPLLQRAHALSALITALLLSTACSQPGTVPAPGPSASATAAPTPAQSPSLSPASPLPPAPVASAALPLRQPIKAAGLPFGKEGLAAVNWQDSLWLIGGKGSFGSFDTSIVQFASFGDTTPGISNGGELPVAVSTGYFKYGQSNAVVLGGKLYKGANEGLGGLIRRSKLHKLQRDPETQVWSAREILQLPLDGAPVLVADQSKIYALGGWEDPQINDDGQEAVKDSRAVLAIDPVSAQVTTLAQLPVHTRCMWAVQHEGAIYSIGGYQSQSGHSADILKITLATGKVDKIGQLPSGRSFATGFGCEGATAVVYRGKLVIAGGYRELKQGESYQAQYLADVLAIDPANGQVSTLAQLPSPRSGVALGVYRDKLYAIGGDDGVSALIDVLEIPAP